VTLFSFYLSFSRDENALKDTPFHNLKKNELLNGEDYARN